MKKYNLTLIGILFFSLSFSQSVIEKDDESSVTNDVYKRTHHTEKELVILPQQRMREADVMWSRKIWREIDLRQKMNLPLYYPQEDIATNETVDRDNLFKALYDAVIRGENSMRAFNAELDDEFRQELTREELQQAVEGKEFPVYYKSLNLYTQGEDSVDVNGNKVIKEMGRKNELRQSDIIKWRLKEQWFFDKQRSMMDVKIIGIAPLKQDRNEKLELTGTYTPICWFYFQDARKILKNSQAFNLVKNEAENKTFEDIFIKRMFSSTIVKEGNVYNRKVDQYMVGLDALLEAERIKTEIFNIEHDLWEY